MTARTRRSRQMTRHRPAPFLSTLLPAAPYSQPQRTLGRLPVAAPSALQRNSPGRRQTARRPQLPSPSPWCQLSSWATSGRHSLGSSASVRLGSHPTVNWELWCSTGWVSSSASVTAAVMRAQDCSGGLTRTPARRSAASVWSHWRTSTGCRRGGWCSSATRKETAQSRYEGVKSGWNEKYNYPLSSSSNSQINQVCLWWYCLFVQDVAAYLYVPFCHGFSP